VENKETFTAIKSTVHSFLPDAEVLLFGSRARDESNSQSDYDLLIVTPDTFAPRTKMEWENKVRKALVRLFNAPFDVILQSRSEVKEKRDLLGHIVYFALKDAVVL
jgi:predicted nucleotidyltransferase